MFEKKYKKSILNVLLGAGFHTSIVFLIPFLFIRIDVTRIKAIYLLIISSVLPLIDVTLFLKIPIFSRYSHYIESRFNVNLSIFHYFKFYILWIILGLFVLNLKKYKNHSMDQLMLNGILMSMLIYGLSFQFAPLIRINSFFKIFEFGFLIYFLDEVGNFYYFIKRGIIISLSLIIYLGFTVTDPYNIVHYQYRTLRIRDEKTTDQLWEEINK